MIRRPVILGMNSPQSEDPADALRPWDGASAGGRLLTMLQRAAERAGSWTVPSTDEYLRVFDRRNLVPYRNWSAREARRLAPSVIESLQAGDVTVVLCGRAVERATRLPRLDWLIWGDYSWIPDLRLRYCVVPHPSGRTREYNDPELRARVGDLLLELYDAYVSAEGAAA